MNIREILIGSVFLCLATPGVSFAADASDDVPSADFSAFTTVSESAMTADYFTGPFLGINLGYEGGNDTLKWTDDEGGYIKLFGGINQPTLGAFAGYGHLFSNQFYLGGDVFYRTAFNSTAFIDEDGSTDLRSRNTYGIEFTPGYVIAPRVLVNLILGVENTQFKLTQTPDAFGDLGFDTFSSTILSKRSWGVFPGVGIKVAVTHNLQVGAAYTYQFYNSMTASGTEDTAIKLSPKRSLFALNLAYRFSAGSNDNTTSSDLASFAGFNLTTSDYFTGPLVGINLGYQSISDSFKLSDNSDDYATLVGATSQPTLGAFAGYGYLFNNQFYLGGDAFYRTTFNSSALLEEVEDYSINLRSRNTYGIEFTPGYVIAPRVLVNLILGVENTQFKITQTADNDGDFPVDGFSSTIFSKRSWGIFPGLGVKVAVTHNLQVGAAYTYQFYNSMTASSNDRDRDAVKLSPERGLFQLSLAYRFTI